ncbi:hypothetical protein [Streptomyces sp. NPDC005799]|uniref:hypothetical protein n=1 Tax=Streptomyces sp. NPDC005799 TaxID=3154678 RepID=UPI0033F9B996
MSTPVDPRRFHLTLSGTGGPIMHGWWRREVTAHSKFSSWVGSWGRPGTRITLVDEQEGAVLTSWSDNT